MPQNPPKCFAATFFVLTLIVSAAYTVTATAAPAEAKANAFELHLTPMPTPRDVYAIELRKVPGAPPSANSEQWEVDGDLRFVRNVTRPTITPVLPDAGKMTGAAVIIAPGGGFAALSIDNEGYKVARWLADHGVAGIVLKYRTEPTPADTQMFVTAFKARIAKIAANPTSKLSGEAAAVEDGLDALRVARQRAEEMGVDPKRIGFLGFSAGAITAIGVALNQDASQRPAFVASVYGSMQARAVPADAPPLFIAHAVDDHVLGVGDLGLLKSWRKANAPVELHLYAHGGHGFGASERGTTSDHWLDEFYWWLSAQGVLKPAK